MKLKLQKISRRHTFLPSMYLSTEKLPRLMKVKEREANANILYEKGKKLNSILMINYNHIETRDKNLFPFVLCYETALCCCWAMRQRRNVCCCSRLSKRVYLQTSSGSRFFWVRFFENSRKIDDIRGLNWANCSLGPQVSQLSLNDFQLFLVLT